MYFPGLPLQLLLQLVEKAPVGALGEDPLWMRLDHARLMEPEAVKTDRVLRGVLTPLSIGNIAHKLKRVLVLPRVALGRQGAGGPIRLQGAYFGRLEDGTDRTLGGPRVAVDELAISGQHATEVLRPGSVDRRSHHNMADPLGAELLGRGRKGQVRVNPSLGEQLDGLGRWIEYRVHILPGMEPDVTHKGVEKDEGRDRIGHRHRAPLQVTDGLDMLGPNQLEAADVASRQEYDRRAAIKLDQEGAHKVHGEVGSAGGEAPRNPYPSAL